MTWRVTVRIGLTSDANSNIRNSIVSPVFTTMGLQNVATATWEGPGVSEAVAAQQLGNLITALANSPVVAGSSGFLNHLWIYIVNDTVPVTASTLGYDVIDDD